MDEIYQSACTVESECVAMKGGVDPSTGLVCNALVSALGQYMMHVLKSVEMRMRAPRAELGKRKNIINSLKEDISEKRFRRNDESDEIDVLVERTHTAGSNALSDMSERLVPYYCAASSMVWIVPELIIYIYIFLIIPYSHIA